MTLQRVRRGNVPYVLYILVYTVFYAYNMLWRGFALHGLRPSEAMFRLLQNAEFKGAHGNSSRQCCSEDCRF